MKPRYILVDHENVQPKDLALLDGQPGKVIVFLGASQTKVSTELAAAMQARGKDGGEYVRISGNGRNALDFHIAFYLGELAAKEPSASFHVISKDDGYDPLLEHLAGKGVAAQRSGGLAALVVSTDEQLEMVKKHLAGLSGRPSTVKTLGSTINHRLGKTLSQQRISELIGELQRAGVITVTGQKVTYKEKGSPSRKARAASAGA